MKNYEALKQQGDVIWNIANLLRAPYRPPQYRRVMIPVAEVFSTTVANANIHLRNILKEDEQEADSVVKESLITAADGKRYRTKLYRLEMILAVG